MTARGADALERARAAIEAETGARVSAHVCDMSDGAAVRALAARLMRDDERLDVLINNSGGPPPGRFSDLPQAAWDKAYLDVLAPVLETTRAFLPALIAARGAVVNIQSASVRNPYPDLILSNSLRLGVVGWAKSIAHELAPHGVRVNTVGPGFTRTERAAGLVRARAAASNRSLDEAEAAIAATIPMRRIGEPEEIADVAVFLASPRASYLTGAVIAVDGGASSFPL